MELNAIQVVSLTATLLLVAVLGILSARGVKSAEDFSVGGRSAGAAIVSGSIVGTIVGGAATMGTAQLAFSAGLSAWWFTLGSGIGLLVMAAFYAGPFRRSGLETISQYLVAHYGRAAGPVVSVASSLGIFFSIVASMLTSVHLLATVFGMRPEAAAGITVLIVVAYVFFGGINGAGLSGIFKLAVLYVTLVVAGATAFRSAGGTVGLQAFFPAEPWFDLFGRGFWLDAGNAVSLVVGIISTQTYVQALFAARDARTAAVGSLAAALVTIPIGLPSIMVGMYMHESHPEILPIDALPLYLMHSLPGWLGGAAVAGLLLSSVGSVAGLALGVGTMVSRDILGELLGWRGARRLLWLNRGCILAITLAAALFVFGNMQSLVLEWNFLSMALRGVGIFVPLTLAIFCPGRLPPKAALASMVAGIAAALAGNAIHPAANVPLFAGLAASLAVAVAGMRLQEMARDYCA